MSQRESGQVIHDGLWARYRMTHKESERCSKHNDDVETVVGKQGSGPGSARKGNKRGKRCAGTRMVVTLPLFYPGATL